MINNLTISQIDDALALDAIEGDIPQLEYLEARYVSEKLINHAGTDTFALITLAMIHGYKIGWYKAQLLNKSAKNTKA